MRKEHDLSNLNEFLEQPSINEVTYHEVVGIFLQSFYISQGSQELQKQLFEYIRHIHPDWRLTESVIDALVDSGEAMGINLMKQRAHNTTTTDPRSRLMYSQMARALQRRLEDENPLEHRSLLQQILKAIIQRDARYLRVRPDRKITETDDQPLLQKRHFSQVCHFILQENSIRVSEFDHMFEELRELLIEQADTEYVENISPEHVRLLQDLVVEHNRHNEGELTLPGFLAR